MNAAAGSRHSTAAAASLALNSTKGAHPTLRLDSFLRSTDSGYQHGEAHTQGDRFVRKMATYGQVRPSVSFTSESRVTRPVQEHLAVDMSNLPPPWMDPRGDPRELTFAYPEPPKECNTDHIKMFENHGLMTPAERYREHLLMKAGHAKWKKDREDTFLYKKRMTLLEREHGQGILGIDSPMHPDTNLFRQQRQYFEGHADHRGAHAEARFGHLGAQKYADDATAQRQYGEPTNFHRSQDICVQRKRIDPEQHPHRFLDTHNRLFPTHVPVWDPERAAVLRSHEVRDKKHDHINQQDNTISYRPAPSYYSEELSKSLPNIKVAAENSPS